MALCFYYFRTIILSSVVFSWLIMSLNVRPSFVGLCPNYGTIGLPTQPRAAMPTWLNGLLSSITPSTNGSLLSVLFFEIRSFNMCIFPGDVYGGSAWSFSVLTSRSGVYRVPKKLCVGLGSVFM